MTKSEAITLFGGKQRDLARALGINQSRVSQLPEQLEQRYVDRIVGAAIRLGRLRFRPDIASINGD